MSETAPTLVPHVHESDRSRLVAYDHGAHLVEWTVDGRRVVWVSDEAVLDGSAPIRGGVPICFPWFAGGPQDDLTPSHGVVRTATWRPTETDGAEVWAWELDSSDVIEAPGAEHLPGPFRARYAVALEQEDGTETLVLRLRLTNTGPDDYRAEAALHTYLAVDDVRQVRVLGLEGAGYLDKVTGEHEVQDGPVTMEGETDRVYERSGPVTLADADGRALLELRPGGAAQTVVWNPWADQAVRLADLGDEEWTRFVCVETVARGERALTLRAGDTTEVSCRMVPLLSPTA
ncbi:D-hexose-6-phosphate mutarotase [Ornithinimicrobium humiphilum]|uniref:Putative glucose-6-phosphate 1-epimerase n=1 Tax=Ornithinimicrobium humiphilum TaxID=125288 RepID=A0A543KP30_9MICO|nr:D-hexose-6-phosphate mutarotase [Ornithinimicrobium humiphilum]TQM96839.1 glucose-6-phosphate 1-epimerase [Ornithinimicrobium humiphilum]